MTIPSLTMTRSGRVATLVHRARGAISAIPESAIALLGRFSIAAVFWNSGQTKVEGLQVNLVDGRLELGMPRLAQSAVDLFRDEYRLPLIPAEWAALMAAFGEHLLPMLILIGLGTRVAAIGLLAMSKTIAPRTALNAPTREAPRSSR